ncbi:MAG: M6 family metalloprotease domain-containing protein [Bacteroidales bacterium]
MKKRAHFLLIAFSLIIPVNLSGQTKNKGELKNLVCFVRFADEQPDVFTHTSSFYEQLFNDETRGANSVYRYFKESSYNQLEWKSVFYPQAASFISSLQLTNARNFYQPYEALSNPDGYRDALSAISREQAMVKEIVSRLAVSFPDTDIIDADHNGWVDNLCLVFSGKSGYSASHLLWPHRSALQLQNVPDINGVKVNEYLMLFDEANGFASLRPQTINTGVICHEMSHALGTYDLYHTQPGLNPIGVWDLMSDNLIVPQQMSAYTKYKYAGWIDEIPLITTPGVYMLNPIGGELTENLAYRIKPTGSDEYFIVEYRRKEGSFDIGIPQSGLLVYRVNPHATGNLNYNGTDRFDELYLFRPGGTVGSDGNIAAAPFSAESGRDAFGGSALQKPFYTNGKEAKFALANISACAETLSFELLPIPAAIYLRDTLVNLSGSVGSSAQLRLESDVAWRVSDLPEWLSVFPSQGEKGNSMLTVSVLSANHTSSLREATINIEAIGQLDLREPLRVVQGSSLIKAPTGLHGEVSDNTIRLTWRAPEEGEPLLDNGFETTAQVALWRIRNEGNSGWKWCEDTRSTTAYSGNYSMRLYDDWDEQHQDEWLISNLFSYGKTLSFYSKSIAPGKMNQYNSYEVLVSSDAGESWNKIWDLMADGNEVNKYERVELDLTSYLSDRMQIAFHAYDTNEAGHAYLSYWWQIDDVTVYPQQESSLIDAYRIYRNDEYIGSSTVCEFTDATPLPESSSYKVAATGNWGISDFSESVSVKFTTAGSLVKKDEDIHVFTDRSNLYIRSERIVSAIHVYTATGQLIDRIDTNDKVIVRPLPGTNTFCILRLVLQDGTIWMKKIMQE